MTATSGLRAHEGFERHEHEVNGVRTVVLSAGRGDPLVLFHGAGTVTGFDWALPLAERFRLVVPVHPGFGDSADDPLIDSIHDYVLHYLDLMDRLGLERFRLVGHSMGGWMAAWFALEQPQRVARLALVSPAGLEVAEAPATDLMAVPPREVPGYLTERPEVFARAVAELGEDEATGLRLREAASAGRVFAGHQVDSHQGGGRGGDPKLARWLHRAVMPTLVIWGERDRLLPAGQAKAWVSLLPRGEVAIVADRGHLVLEEGPEPLQLIATFMG